MQLFLLHFVPIEGAGISARKVNRRSLFAFSTYIITQLNVRIPCTHINNF